MQAIRATTLTVKEVKTCRAGIDARICGRILAQTVVRCHDTPDHIINSLDRDAAIVDCGGQIASKE
jgi:hypothetical protein